MSGHFPHVKTWCSGNREHWINVLAANIHKKTNLIFFNVTKMKLKPDGMWLLNRCRSGCNKNNLILS